MSNTSPLPGLVQFTAETLRQYANAYADAVDKDAERYKREIPERVKRLYKIRPDLAEYRVTFLGIPLYMETVFTSDGSIAKVEGTDWGANMFADDRRTVLVHHACNLPGYSPYNQYTTGRTWLERVRGLSDSAVVFINADDSGILTAGYTPFPEFSEDVAKAATKIE